VLISYIDRNLTHRFLHWFHNRIAPLKKVLSESFEFNQSPACSLIFVTVEGFRALWQLSLDEI